MCLFPSFQNLIQMTINQQHTDLIIRSIEQAKRFAFKLNNFHKDRDTRFSIDIPFASQAAVDSVSDFSIQQALVLSPTFIAPFCCHVEATTTLRNEPQREHYLFSKKRFPGFIDINEALLYPWTSPLYAQIRSARPSSTVNFEGPGGRPVSHVIHSSSDWAILLPKAKGVCIRLQNEDLVIADEDLLSQIDGVLVLSAGGNAANYQQTVPEAQAVKQEYGLGEIITLADSSQLAAMQMPFRDNILIEGPPGSGKTSIGLMRIPCLIDRQWEELERNQAKDRPFHTYESVKVLVMNSEMVPYLDRLMRDISATEVHVETLTDFCRDVCEASKLTILPGRERKCTSGLDRVKYSQYGFESFCTAVKKRITEHWTDTHKELFRKLSDVHLELGTSLFKLIEVWIATVNTCPISLETTNPGLKICQILNEWIILESKKYAPSEFQPVFQNNQTITNEDRAKIRDGIKRLAGMCNTFLRNTFDRKCIVDQILPNRELSESFVSEWKEQALRSTKGLAIRTEADYVLHGFLTSLFLLSSSSSKESPQIGGKRPYLTHVVIDETQDISRVHLLMLNQLLDSEGSFTLVGDLQQRIDGPGYFNNWNELPLKKAKHAVFSVNHRQTKEIGTFVRDQHQNLFGRPATWSPSQRSGPKVRNLQTSTKNLGISIGDEVLKWIHEYPTCTCGVLFIDDLPTEELVQLETEVAIALEEKCISVELALRDSSARQLRRDSGVILAPVGLTKGLEFDVVVLVAPIIQESETQKNRFYVGCSRARTALSVIKHS